MARRQQRWRTKNQKKERNDHTVTAGDSEEAKPIFEMQVATPDSESESDALAVMVVGAPMLHSTFRSVQRSAQSS
jgi:hypothetical protein